MTKSDLVEELKRLEVCAHSAGATALVLGNEDDALWFDEMRTGLLSLIKRAEEEEK